MGSQWSYTMAKWWFETLTTIVWEYSGKGSLRRSPRQPFLTSDVSNERLSRTSDMFAISMGCLREALLLPNMLETLVHAISLAWVFQCHFNLWNNLGFFCHMLPNNRFRYLTSLSHLLILYSFCITYTARSKPVPFNLHLKWYSS